MLVHICCSVDSFYYLKRLQEVYPDEPLTGFFYDPNIHPYSEYYLRMIDAKRSCERLGVEFIEGSYDLEGWFEAVRGYESAPEKGARCKICFDNRLEESAKKAKELGHTSVTTTLLMSPKKEFSTLKRVSLELESRYGIQFVIEDFRQGGGTQAQFALSKAQKAYHQNYCGCLFALEKQREVQQKYASELISPLNGATLLGSIEARIELYESRMDCEVQGKAYEIERRKVLNYRLLRGRIQQNGEVVPSLILPYSTTRKTPFKQKLRIDRMHAGVGYLNREEGKVMMLHEVNQILGSDYASIQSMMWDKMSEKRLLKLRHAMSDEAFDLSPMILIDRFEIGDRIELDFDYRIYEDTSEFLAIFS